MSREGLFFFLVFFKNSYKKDPPIALDFDHKILLCETDRCAGKCRQESELFLLFLLWL